MIRILMFDLGETLIHGDTVFPHVLEALAAWPARLAGDGVH
jgi:FMN phosphatase YigB (HAD superfamily)